MLDLSVFYMLILASAPACCSPKPHQLCEVAERSGLQPACATQGDGRVKRRRRRRLILVVHIVGLAADSGNLRKRGDALVEDGVEGVIFQSRYVDAIEQRMIQMIVNPDLCLDMGRKSAMNGRQKTTWKDSGLRSWEILEKALHARL